MLLLLLSQAYSGLCAQLLYHCSHRLMGSRLHSPEVVKTLMWLWTLPLSIFLLKHVLRPIERGYKYYQKL